MAEPTAIVPDKGIRPGFNETGSTIATRLFVVATAGGAPDSIVLASAGEAAKGVTMAAIDDDVRGDIQVEGMAIVTASAAIARGAQVAATAAGQAVTAVATDVVLGIARSASAGAAEDIEVELTGPARNVAV